MAMSKRTKALAIPKSVKDAVWNRDDRKCVYCGGTYLAFPEAHFIPRSHGGLGVEQNVLTLCRVCHDTYDHTHRRDEMRAFFADYLAAHYPGWNEQNLIYRR
ncbi:HNH endonuclease [Sporobacter termitidis]|uniref:HNH endonuclease n=1 Tax=Sporobacter termitidis TaxID=44749 RepID=UPI000933A555